MKIITSVILFFAFAAAYAQQSKIDSLSIAFNKTAQDTVKAKILAEIGIAAYHIDFKKAKYYNDSLIRFSKNRSKTYEAFGYRMRGTLELIDGDFTSSEKSYLQSLSIFENLGDKAYQGALVANLATLYARQNQIAKADSMYLVSIALIESTKFKKQATNSYLNLGINALNANRLELATGYFLNTLRLAEETEDKNNQFYAHSQLGALYLKRQLYDNAEESLKKALVIGANLDNKMGLAMLYISLGNLSEAYGKHIQALDYFILSKEAAESVNDKHKILEAHIQIGRQFSILEKYVDAESSLKKALEITTTLQDSSNIVTTNLNLAILFLKTQRVKEAKRALQQGEIFMPKIPDADYYLQYKEIANEYKVLSNNSEAYRYLLRYAQIADSLNLKNDTGKIVEIETKFQTKKKEKENLELRADNAEQAVEVQKANTQKWLLIAGLLVALSSVFFIWRRYKEEARAKQTIAAQRDEIQQQKDLVETLQKELHHRVKNNLSIIASFIEVAKEGFNDKRYLEKLSELQNRVHSINEVHLQLYKNEKVTNLNLSKYLDALVQNVSDSFNSKSIVVEKAVKDKLRVSSQMSFAIGLMINEFLTNSYKYAFENNVGRIKIELNEIGTDFILMLIDNGKGMPQDFDINTSPSFGIRIMKLLAKQLNGSFEITNRNGVQVTIKFPKE